MKSLPNKSVAIAALPFLLASCGSSAVKVCEASIKSTLINPETAEFHDFRDLNEAEYVAILAAGIAEGAGHPVSVENKKVTAQLMHKMQSEKPAGLHTVRLRSEGRIGNKITSQMLCLSNQDGCMCRDPVADGRNG